MVLTRHYSSTIVATTLMVVVTRILLRALGWRSSSASYSVEAVASTALILALVEARNSWILIPAGLSTIEEDTSTRSEMFRSVQLRAL